jgi:cellulose synthase operon protein YhjQ
MDSHGTDKVDDLAVAETPEDVAVLYSWANLHGAKYRDFSASRREYRAQLRHRAAEQVREQALLAQGEAETAAAAADAAARQAKEAARKRHPEESDSSVQRSLREAEDAARTAAAERVEAARRAEAAAVAEAAARREEREIAEAHASAQRQAARYADSEIRRRTMAEVQPVAPELPGKISDPYTIYSTTHSTVSPVVPTQPQMESAPTMQNSTRPSQDPAPSNDVRDTDSQLSQTSVPAPTERRSPVPLQAAPRRPQGYRPDDASGVRQIYRGPDYDARPAEYTAADPVRHSAQTQIRPMPVSTPLAGPTQDMKPTDLLESSPRLSSSDGRNDVQMPPVGQRRTDSQPAPGVRPPQAGSASAATPDGPSIWSANAHDRSDSVSPRQGFGREPDVNPPYGRTPATRPVLNSHQPAAIPVSHRPVSPFSQALVPSNSTRGRRAQDDFDYQQGAPESSQRGVPEPPTEPIVAASHPAYPPDPAGPAWLYAPPAPQVSQRPLTSPPVATQSSVADTLQHSRERVAARWFALKGVFEQPGQELDAAPVRQKETRTPVLAVFSLAGGVGKTSLVATVGRSLSSMGEKVLLTDTTSHGLLPFYFGASELRQGTVRTFSPPSGSTDAPIYLVSYDVDQKGSDEDAQEFLAEEIINNSRGMHRILLDLTVSSSWIVRHMSRMNPTILVPVAPDMNSVISLQTVEKFFSGVNDGDGRPLQPYYVLNQFDTSLPLHLDVREVMRRQLGDRLLPFVIRRAPAVSEALAEGMTVVDYAPDAPVAEDYLNLSTWLRTVAAPATAGFRNVRWSER